MKKVSLFAVIVMVLGLGFVTNVKANTYAPVGNENTISVSIDLDGGIVDPDEEDKEEKEDRKS